MDTDDETRRMRETFASMERALRGSAARLADPVNVAQLRGRMNLTQAQLASRFGFPVATLRHWERGDRKPGGAALVLLNVIARRPRAVLESLRPQQCEYRGRAGARWQDDW